MSSSLHICGLATLISGPALVFISVFQKKFFFWSRLSDWHRPVNDLCFKTDCSENTFQKLQTGLFPPSASKNPSRCMGAHHVSHVMMPHGPEGQYKPSKHHHQTRKQLLPTKKIRNLKISKQTTENHR